jgi:hypothetical protein
VELDVTDDGSVDRAIASILAEAGKIVSAVSVPPSIEGVERGMIDL